MRDEYDDRLNNGGREAMNMAIDQLLVRIMQAFCVLHHVQWSAPWHDEHGCRP